MPATLTNSTRVMEGLWMLKHGGTYFLFGSPLVVYDVADDFCKDRALLTRVRC